MSYLHVDLKMADKRLPCIINFLFKALQISWLSKYSRLNLIPLFR